MKEFEIEVEEIRTIKLKVVAPNCVQAQNLAKKLVNENPEKFMGQWKISCQNAW